MILLAGHLHFSTRKMNIPRDDPKVFTACGQDGIDQIALLQKGGIGAAFFNRFMAKGARRVGLGVHINQKNRAAQFSKTRRQVH